MLFPIADGRDGHAQRGGEPGLGEFGLGADRLDVRPGRDAALGGVAFGIGDGTG